MAITTTKLTVSGLASVAFGANDTSDEETSADTALVGEFQLSADNDGTPAAADTMDFWILKNVKASISADTVLHAEFLAQLDTNGEDPARKTVTVSLAGVVSFQIYCVNNSAGRAITPAVAYTEVRG